HLDLILFNKYFEWAEMNDEGPGDSGSQPRASIIIGILLAIIWVIAVIKFNPAGFDFVEAYNTLLNASLGALIGGGVMWGLRAIYFYIRGVEGMGLGDVKMMAISGAYLGWRGAIFVMLISSLIGVAAGIILAIRSRRGLKTALPYGVCLGIASLIVLLI
ncbi:MAG: prepilin peptidase, partial [Blastocatellia bacterium]|nr:prepilin peptidase [Blastocatellia bacterium]